jgi:hypothetical protein
MGLKFDKNRKRVEKCPCGEDNKNQKFSPYEGYTDKGHCHSCDKTFLPELPKVEQNNTSQSARYTKSNFQRDRQIDFIPKTIFVKQFSSVNHLYSENHFIQWLGNPQRGEFAFDDKTIIHLIENYFLANSNKYKGWVLFPYIDIEGNIRDIKAMDYNPTSGKRISTKNGDSQNRCHFIGKEILNNPEANTERCFYGEHLLKGNNKLVRVFESEATATQTAPFYPNSVCIATGGSNGCKWTEKGKCSVLKRRTVILYPDIDAHDNWVQKAEILRGYGINVQVSTLIKNKALKFAEQNGIQYSDLVKGKYDLRDILKYKKLSDFLESESTEPPPSSQQYCEKGSTDLEKLPIEKLLANEVIYSSCFTLEGFQKMARSHAAMNKRVQPEKYFKAWVQSMSALLDQSGISNEQFLNSLL